MKYLYAALELMSSPSFPAGVIWNPWAMGYIQNKFLCMGSLLGKGFDS